MGGCRTYLLKAMNLTKCRRGQGYVGPCWKFQGRSSNSSWFVPLDSIGDCVDPSNMELASEMFLFLAVDPTRPDRCAASRRPVGRHSGELMTMT